MSDQPQIHFTKSPTIEQCEKDVNAWINSLPFLCTVLNINMLPLMMNGSILFIACITYTKQPDYTQPEPNWRGRGD